MEKGTTVQILDHGYMKYIDSMGNDEAIVEAARMSTDKGFISWDPYIRCKKCSTVLPMPEGAHAVVPPSECSHDFEKAPNGDLGLLDNLWRNRHATPFEMGELVIEVQAPIFVFREWHRHRTQSYNELSARYTQMPNLHYLPNPERIQKQSAHNKQGSAEPVPKEDAGRILLKLEMEQMEIYENYDGLVEEGVAKEIARINTPVSRYSKMRAKGNVRNWFGFCNLRKRPGAQWEIRQFTDALGNIIQSIWPKAWALFEEYDLYGASFSRTELEIIRRNLGMGSLEMDAGSDLKGTKLKEFMNKIEFGGKKIL